MRRADSMTPPEAAKMSPEPVGAPKGLSNSSSGRLAKSMPKICIMRLSCRVVITASTSATPVSEESSGRCASNFLAVQGMTETTKMSLGSMFCFLREVALDGGAHHLLRGLAGGDVRQQLGVVDLRVLDPRRAAGGEQGQLLPLLDPLHQLRALLHDREVGGEVRVEDLAEADAPQRRGHLARDVRSRREARRSRPGRRGWRGRPAPRGTSSPPGGSA